MMTSKHYVPLAERMRPETLDDVVGQEHLTGPKGILRQLLERDFLPSMLFWGPPGTGKTTLAYILAKESNRPFETLSAVHAGVKDIKKILETYKADRLFGQPPVVFIDEIHRFNKAQQDALLQAVEKGQITLIGATTENPGFEINNALLSRMHTFILNPLKKDDLKKLIRRALENDLLLKQKGIKKIDEDVLTTYAAGDARRLLNALETVVLSSDKPEILKADIEELLKTRIQSYDKKGDWHYDVISAFIKSVRGSDPDAAVYWLARMIEVGEEPEFIARRLVILAAEDIGLANPNALLMANATFDAVNKIGWPEAKIVLAEATVYLASSPKSNSAYMAIKKAESEVKKSGALPVPLHLRPGDTAFERKLGYGKDYQYPHGFENRFVEQNYFPEELQNKFFYEPAENPHENKIKQFLKARWKKRYD